MLAQPSNNTSLGTAWQPVGPLQIASLVYGSVTGRVTAVAIDPADATGNTVYLGTTGGGVWKSVNAAGAAASVVFTPLTDSLPVFSPNAGSATIASLSIGALSVANGVLLAGTGDPNDALDSYYGSGVLRSADGGVTWTLAQESQDGVDGNHSFVGLGFASLAWNSVMPSRVVAAVSDAAEGELVNAPDATYSVRGLYYSTDSGVTWQMAVVQDGNQTVQSPQPEGLNVGGNAATSVVWNPMRQRFYAAVRYHGYYESADGSVWDRLAAQPGVGLTAMNCPADPGTTGSPTCPIFRGVLAVEPVSGDTFAFTVDAQLRDQGIWRDACHKTDSTCASSEVSFGSQLNAAPLEQAGGTIPQGDYDLSLAAVVSGSDTLVFAGAVDLYRCSLAAGCSFRNTTNTENGCVASALVAPAQHTMATLATAAGPMLYLGNDGGLWRSTDGVDQQGTPCSSSDASHFQNLNQGLGSLAEVVGFSQHPSNSDTLLVGVGANGTAATASASENAPWPQLAASEGGFNAIDPVTPANWYISTGPGVAISYCGKGADCAASDFADLPEVGPAQVEQDASLIDPPWILDPALTSNLLLGTCRVWRGPAAVGSDWTDSNALSETFGDADETFCGIENSYVRSLAAGGPAGTSTANSVANAGSEVLYAGLAGLLDGGGLLGGHLLSTASGNTAGPTTAWSDLALSPVTNAASEGGLFNPGGFDISAVGVDPHDASGATVYATVAGFAGNGIDAAHVYRSIDAGAHWTNISGNLPNAPANGVVVDPNDANTVYVALDTGVYTTRQVASCATADCWSVYGTGLPNSPVVQLASASAMPTGSGGLGVLRAATYGRGIWEIPLLTTAPPTMAQIALTPDALSFAAQAIGTASSAKTIVISNNGANTGTAPLVVSSLAVTGPFQETDDCAGAAIAPGASCAAQVVYFAASLGTNSGTLAVYANIPGGQATATLTGIGTATAAVALSPLSLAFGTLTIGQAGPARNIAVSNTGGEPATLQTPMVTGDFAVAADTCGATLAPSTGCTVAIVFTPTASGTRNGTFSITDSTGTQIVTQSASLTGVGASQATDSITPLALAFPIQQVGTKSASQAVTLTNSGDSSLTLIAIQVSGGGFIATNGCGAVLIGHASCAVSVSYSPTSVGAISGVLTVSDQFRAQTVALSGTGLAPPGVSLTPFAGLTFSATGVTVTSAAQTVTLFNQGGSPLAIAGIAVTGDFFIPAASNTCQTTVAADAACTFQVVFTPTAVGPRVGNVTVTDNAAGSPQSGSSQTLALQGTGVDFTLTSNGAASVTIASGASAVFPLLLSSAAGVSGTAALTCTGAPANASCLVVPSSVPLGESATLTATVETGVTASASLIPPEDRGAWWAVAFPLAFLLTGLSKRRRYRFLLVCLLGATGCIAGCGVGRTIPGSPESSTNAGPISTPSGTYSIVVSATSAGLTHSVTLKLVVQ